VYKEGEIAWVEQQRQRTKACPFVWKRGCMRTFPLILAAPGILVVGGVGGCVAGTCLGASIPIDHGTCSLRGYAILGGLIGLAGGTVAGIVGMIQLATAMRTRGDDE
jgi:hypothetical protein